MKACIPWAKEDTTISFPVARTGKRATGLIAITLSGKMLTPLFILKRTSLDREFACSPFFSCGIYRHSPSGFINGDIFFAWVTEVLVEHVRLFREKLVFSGSAHLLLDGFSAHSDPRVLEICAKERINLFFLPPHSSHLTQPLDLGIFGVQKISTRKIPQQQDKQNKHVTCTEFFHHYTGQQHQQT